MALTVRERIKLALLTKWLEKVPAPSLRTTRMDGQSVPELLDSAHPQMLQDAILHMVLKDMHDDLQARQ